MSNQVNADPCFIITGASGDMGSAAVRAIAAQGFPVVMACRNLDKAISVKSQILTEQPDARLEIQELRMDSFASIRDFALRMQSRQIRGLFNNAGVLPRHFGRTVDGFEQTLAVNYIGPYLLTRLLLPSLCPNGSIVNMVSLSSHYVHFGRDIFDRGEESFGQLRSYALSKLALMYFTMSLAQKCSGRIHVNMADPGIVDTQMIRLDRWFDPLTDVIFRPFCHSPRKGAAPAVKALLSDQNAKLFSGKSSSDLPPSIIKASADAEWLWNETAKRTGLVG